MELVEILLKDADRIAPLVAAFRVQLKSYKGIIAQPNIEAGKEEIIEFLNSGFPVYAVADDGALVGYIVCRVDEPAYGSNISTYGKIFEEKAPLLCFSEKLKRSLPLWGKIPSIILSIRITKA